MQSHAGEGDSWFHGVATFAGVTRNAYYDLGGYYILADDEDWGEICERVSAGLDTVTRIIPHMEIAGSTENGVPVDVAVSSSGGSSVCYIRKWVRTTVEITTHHGMNHILHGQLVGFVARSTPLLILGQQACRLCGYKTIEMQDAEAQADAARNAEQVSPSQAKEHNVARVTEATCITGRESRGIMRNRTRSDIKRSRSVTTNKCDSAPDDDDDAGSVRRVAVQCR